MITSPANKAAALLHILTLPRPGPALVLLSSISSTTYLAAALQCCPTLLTPIIAHTSSIPPAQRQRNLQRVKAGEVGVVLATDGISRGMDIPSLAVVVNFDMPQNARLYVHRAGRTARAGR